MARDGSLSGSGDASPAEASPDAISPFLRNLLVFGRALRSAGIEASLEQVLAFARALAWVDIGSREQVFHAARALLVSRREDLRLFGIVFNRFWLGIAEPPAKRRLPLAPRADLSPRPAVSGELSGAARRGPRTPGSRWPTAPRPTAPRRCCGGATSRA